MSKLYCIFQKNKYDAELEGDIVEIVSYKATNGFENYVDVLGNIHDDIFIKKIDVHNVEMLFYEDIYIKYQGIYFQLFTEKITEYSLLNNDFVIWTASEDLADKNDFEKKEQFEFIKNITKEQIEGVKLVTRPISIFKNEVEKEEVLEGDTLRKWFAKLF